MTEDIILNNDNAKPIVLALEGNRLTSPPKQDSPDAWNKFLELSIKSPLIYGTIVTLVSLIHMQSWHIEGNKAKHIEQLFIDSGFNTWKFDLIMESMLLGNSFVEFVTPKNSKKLDRLVKIEDPTTMDIKREGFQYLLDQYGQPIAYIQNLGTDTIEIPADRIAHLKLFRYPSRVFGVGLVEPIYLYEEARIRVISNITLFSERLNRPLFTIVAKTPLTESNALSANEIEQIRNELRKLNTSGALFLGAPFDINTISTALSSSWVPLLKFLTGEVMAGLGIPQALLFAELRTTPGLVRSQEKLFQQRVDTLINRVSDEITKTIVRRIDPSSKFIIERPTPLYLKEIVDALAELARAGMLTQDTVVELLRSMWPEFPIQSQYLPNISSNEESTNNENNNSNNEGDIE